MYVNYGLNSANSALGGATTSGTPSTAVDFLFIKPGAGNKIAIYDLRLQGYASAGTTLNGIAAFWEYCTTASTGGTSKTPYPISQIAGLTAAATAATLPSLGTPATIVYRGGCGCSASGPGAWRAANPDDMLDLPAGAAGSYDLIALSPTASQVFAWWTAFQE